MKIGFDAKRLFHNKTGLGYYSRTLVQSLLKEDDSLEVCLYDAQPNHSDHSLLFLAESKAKIITTGKPHWYYRSVDMNKYVSASEIDIFHGLSNELPLRKWNRKLPTIVTIHDILYKYFPADFPWLDRQIYQFKTKNALEKADRVIAISEATKNAILQNFKVAEDKIQVIYQSYDPIFNQPTGKEEIDEILKEYRVPAEYLLYVGSITHRKNLMVILQALNSLPAKKRIPLIVAGDGTSYLQLVKEYIASHQLNKWVYFLPNLPRMAIKILYAGAQAVIYPSLGEGFGLPVLESIASNIPVITSSLSSLPEAGGKLAYYFNPTSSEELLETLKKLNKVIWQKKNAILRLDHLKKFSQDIMAKNYLTIYKSL
ncbi:MAG: glycosyltransferase family 1 protein [Saprospiraceae bacterium]